MPPIKILFLLPSLETGGAERVTATLLRHIDRTRFSPHLALLKAAGPLLSDLPEDIEPIDLKRSRVRQAVGAIVRTVRSLRPEIVFSSMGHVNAALLLARPLLPSGTRLIARETIVVSRNSREGLFGLLRPFIYRTLYPRFETVICQSGDMRDDLVKAFSLPPENLRIIPNPVDIDRIIRLADEGPPPPRPSDRTFLVFAGRLTRQKGVDLLLRALAVLPRKTRHLAILGDGPEKPALQRLAKELGIADEVVFSGMKENPYPYIRSADLLVMPSRYEGFPNILLEAGACGTPVTAFRCPGGVNEIITEGLNGTLAEPENVVELAAAIDQAAAVGWEEKRIREFVQERFGAREITKRYEAEFDRF